MPITQPYIRQPTETPHPSKNTYSLPQASKEKKNTQTLKQTTQKAKTRTYIRDTETDRPAGSRRESPLNLETARAVGAAQASVSLVGWVGRRRWVGLEGGGWWRVVDG